ncbi:MAG: glycosyltransferase family 1 protein [Pseudomonadota bacterium]
MTTPTILLDVTRTVARSRLPAPTGIDRVERAYIDWALSLNAYFLVAIDRRQHLVGAETLSRLLDWQDRPDVPLPMDARSLMSPGRDRKLRQAQSLIRREAIATAGRPAQITAMLRGTIEGRAVYINAGHDNLGENLMAALDAAGIPKLVLIHDVIPLDHPEFTRRRVPAQFAEKLQAAALADAILTNSAHTAERMCRYIAPQRLLIAPLGVEVAPPRPPSEDAAPYFLCLGTIEPRKNHQLLMDLWEGFGPDAAPAELWIAGRRGWENKDLFKRLDTSAVIGRGVLELGPVTAAELHDLLSGARAVLFPSLAEGYGLPLAEALAMGIPVIASDLPALREVGGSVPEYLSPTEAQTWSDRITAYAAPGSPERAAQLDRIAGWTAPTWKTHFDIVLNAIETVMAQSMAAG